MAAVVLSIGLLVFLAHVFAIMFQRTRVPDVLLLIGLGLLLGPVLGIVHPEDLGQVGGVIGTVALVVILFEGGTHLDLADLQRSLRPTLLLTLPTFVVTAALVAVAGHLAFDLSWLSAWILGLTLGGTSSAVVIPLVKVLPLSERSRTVLVLESALTDVLCIVGVYALLAIGAGGEPDPFRLLGSVLASLLFAALLGVLGGAAWLRVLELVRRLPNALFATVAFVFIVYGVTELLGFSGAIGALAFGITLTNHERMGVARLVGLSPRKMATLEPLESEFFAEVVFLLKTFFFVYLGQSIRFGDQRAMLLSVAITMAVYLARLLIVLRTSPADTTRYDAAITAIMVPKGLAAAVLAGLVARSGLPGGETVRDVAYAVVLIGIVLTAVMVWAVERRPIRNVVGIATGPIPGPRP